MALIEPSDLSPGIRQILFNRPEKLNALSTPLMREFETALDAAAADPGVRVIVLRGAGGKAFVAGADIAEYQGNKRAEFTAYQFNSRRVFDRLERIGKPVICAVDGFALGGGFEIALCCDILILSETAQLGLPEGRLGLCPGGGGTQRLLRAIGKYAASDLLLAGWRLSAQRALELGIAADVVCLTSPDLVFRALQARQGLGDGDDQILDDLFAPERTAPIVSVLDGHPHTLSFLAAIGGAPIACLGVSDFGQSGDVDDLYREFGIDVDTIVGAASDLL